MNLEERRGTLQLGSGAVIRTECLFTDSLSDQNELVMLRELQGSIQKSGCNVDKYQL